MKALLSLIACIGVLSVSGAASSAAAPATPTRSSMTVLVMIASPQEEKEAAVMIDSLRTFGGEFSQSPVVLVLSDPTKADGKSLAGKVQETVVLKMNEKFRQFPFGDKVYASAQVEELVAGRTDWLVWLNPDCLFVAPPTEIVADREAWTALRPVHVQNVGAPADAPVPEFWKRIYNNSHLDPSNVWTVESLVDGQKIRGYFNSGCMAFAPQRGLLRAWRDDFERLLLDPSNFAFYTSERSYAIFCHQAVLSAVVMEKAGKEKIHMLPPSYGYPLGFQDLPSFTNKIGSLSDLVIIITSGHDNLAKIATKEPHKSWIEANIK